MLIMYIKVYIFIHVCAVCLCVTVYITTDEIKQSVKIYVCPYFNGDTTWFSNTYNHTHTHTHTHMCVYVYKCSCVDHFPVFFSLGLRIAAQCEILKYMITNTLQLSIYTSMNSFNPLKLLALALWNIWDTLSDILESVYAFL